VSGVVNPPPLPREVPELDGELAAVRGLSDRHARLVDEREQLVVAVGGLRDRLAGATADEAPAIQIACDDCAARVAAFEVDLDRWITDVMAEEEAVQEARLPTADAMPGPDASSGDVNRWWVALTRDQQLAIVAASPGSIGNRDGIPPWARDAANTVALGRDLADWGNLEDRGLLTGDERRWLDNARAARDAVATIERGIDPRTLDDVTSQLYLYDPTAFDGDGAVAVAAGDLATARDVAITLPGLGTDALSAQFHADRALDLYEAARSADATGGVATMFWIGYDGDRLADLLDGLRGSREGDPAHLTAIDLAEHSASFDHGSDALDNLSRIVRGHHDAAVREDPEPQI
jgi:hypothetical protein